MDGKSCLHRDSITDRPARSSVAIPTELHAPLHTHTHIHIYIYIYIYIYILFTSQIPGNMKQPQHVTVVSYACRLVQIVMQSFGTKTYLCITITRNMYTLSNENQGT